MLPELDHSAKLGRIGVQSEADTSSVQDERHSYEKCQYEEFKLRVKKMDELRAEKGERSN
jgi:hypothetical protein